MKYLFICLFGHLLFTTSHAQESASTYEELAGVLTESIAENNFQRASAYFVSQPVLWEIVLSLAPLNNQPVPGKEQVDSEYKMLVQQSEKSFTALQSKLHEYGVVPTSLRLSSVDYSSTTGHPNLEGGQMQLHIEAQNTQGGLREIVVQIDLIKFDGHWYWARNFSLYTND
ncbi:MAG: hypothetical protein KF690_02620 [Bacteroidetes bacterium]|nr:hypothetical protein [Bacteroidota bacterium]